MLAVHLSCPHCSRHLRVNRLIAPGESVRCPHCGARFRAGLDDAPDSAAAPEASRGPDIAFGWLLFAGAILLAGGGLAVAVHVHNRSSQTNSTVASTASPEEGARGEGRGAREESGSPLAPRPSPLATPKRPVPLRAAPPARRTPPPLPEPPRPPSAKEKTAKAEKTPAPPAPVVEEAPQVNWLPARIQQRVDRAIDNGIDFLRKQQHADGSWGRQSGTIGQRFTPGITALSALTLLECGVSAKDAQVRCAAAYLRRHMADLTVTYSASLAILFFDRLGEASDAARIRTLALRLVAGQKPSGGWDYYCPALTEDEELGLLALLYKDRPATLRDLFPVERIKAPPEGEPAKEDRGLESDLYKPRPSKAPPLGLFVAIRNPPSAIRQTEKKEEKERRAESGERKAESGKRKADALPGDSRRLSPKALEAADRLPESLRRTPALRLAELLREPPNLREPRSDNSNTQFAILGLLTAENHDVPMERALSLLDWRFRNSLTLQLGWNYQPNWPTTPSMTAAALMGLAVKHGLSLPHSRERRRNVTVLDPLIHQGFGTLDGLLEHYLAGFHLGAARLDKLDLYCLWTVERVAVLYNLRALGTLDWYPAGVQLLLPMQGDDGSWSPAGTKCLEEPAVSSSFALLFLKRSNLARDLTKRLNAPESK